MKIKKTLNCIAAISFTILLGLGVVSFANYFFGASKFQISRTEDISISEMKEKHTEEMILADLEADGFYRFLGDTPEGFEEIKHFRIKTKELASETENKKTYTLISPTGHIETSERFEFEMISVYGYKINFITGKNSDGINYQFNGCYVKSKIFALNRGDKSLVGNLIKKQNGTTVASTSFGLGIFGDLICFF